MAKWYSSRLKPDGENEFWDQALLKDCGIDKTDWAVIPGRYGMPDIVSTSKLIIIGDEESHFDTESHNNIWVQSPHVRQYKTAERFIPIGYTPQTRPILKELSPIKSLDWCFLGQNTHPRRQLAVQKMRTLENGLLVETTGFTKGRSQHEYLANLASSKTTVCPSGAVIPDTFRIWEALEAQSLPIVDGLDPNAESKGYWEHLFGYRPPFPILEDWHDLPGTIEYFCDTYPTYQNRVSAWWQMYKRDLKNAIFKNDNPLTVLIATSPISSHPDIDMIKTTIESIRVFTDAEIIIMFDGVRPEQENYRDRYEKYIENLLWEINHNQNNVVPIIYDEHLHQAEMTRRTLKYVDTPYLMFVEHDTPLTPDCDIPFKQIYDLLDKDANLVRLNHEALILPDHEHLMIAPRETFTRTAQWSQRPHIARTEYYKHIFDRYFDGSKTMIEDRMHSVLQSGWLERGLPGWSEHRVYIYSPEGNQKRSYHLDGRGDDPKWAEE